MTTPRTRPAKLYTTGFKGQIQCLYGPDYKGQVQTIERMTWKQAVKRCDQLDPGSAREIYELVPVKTFKRGQKVSE